MHGVTTKEAAPLVENCDEWGSLGVIKAESNAQSGPMVYPIEAPTRMTLLEVKSLSLFKMS